MADPIQMIPLSEIDVGARLRPAGDAHVEALAASIARGAEAGVGYHGLRSPVELRARPKGERGRAYVLVSGYHRLKALILLGREAAPAQVLTADEAEAALLEVEENLIRADLTALDRALHVRRFRGLFEAAYGPVTRGGDRSFSEGSGQRGNLPLWSEVAQERLGLSGDKLKRALRIANDLDEISIARLQPSPWADNQAFLLEFIGVELAERPHVLDLLLDPDNTLSLREALAHVHGRPESKSREELWLDRALNAVSPSRASGAMRRDFYRAVLMRDVEELRAAVEAEGYELRLRPLAKPPREEG